MDIVKVIQEVSRFGCIPLQLADDEHLRIIDIIAVYSCSDDPIFMYG